MNIDPNDPIVATKVTITKEEYAELIMSQRILEALQSAGVDNWEYYDVAMGDVYGTDESAGDNYGED